MTGTQKKYSNDLRGSNIIFNLCGQTISIYSRLSRQLMRDNKI